MCRTFPTVQRHRIARKHEQLGSCGDSETALEDHCLFIAWQNRRLFKDYAALPVPDGLSNPPEVERVWDLIRVK